MTSIAGIDVHVEGEGPHTIVMVHGWPDTWRLWDAQVAALASRHRCIRFTLPGFDRDLPRRAFTLDELTGFLRQVVEELSPGRPVTLLLHDWGCIFGYEFYMRNKPLVSRIVGVDIGDPVSLRKALTAREALGALAYQVWLALAWKAGGRLGDWMTRRMARLARCPSDPAPVSSCMDYPYWLQWFGGSQSLRHHVHRFEPACPMLFIYGRRKPVRFHSPAWADALRARPGNEVVGFDTGHWVMLQEPQRFNEVLLAWLGTTAAAA